ncbi:MAG: hypothetical protein ABII75_03025 [Candidatus Omnitrophota bacterium]
MVLKKFLFKSSSAGIIFILVFLAGQIDDYFLRCYAAASPRTNNDIILKIFGQLQQDIGLMVYLKADQYYHGGTHHPQHKTAKCLGKEPSGYAPGAKKADFETKDFFTRIYHATREQSVRHLSDGQSREITPWFYLATKLDPQNIKAYVIGGYWLGMRLGKPDEALKFLRQGLFSNPDAWQIYEQVADIYFLVKKDYRKSAVYFERAYSLFNKSDTDVFELKHLLVFLAASYEFLGEYPAALKYHEKLLKINPDDAKLKTKISNLTDVIVRTKEQP